LLDPQLVTHDTALTLDAHVKSLVCSCFYHLKNIAKLSPIVSRSEMEMIIHAFISSRLDYCNSIFTCLSNKKTKITVTSSGCTERCCKASNKIVQVFSCHSIANSTALAPHALQNTLNIFGFNI